MTSWLAGGLKSSLSSLKDQVANSIKDVLDELEEDETDSDLLDEESGRDEATRLLLAVDRLRDVRQKAQNHEKKLAQLHVASQKMEQEKQALEIKEKQFKEILKDKEVEIQFLSTQNGGDDDQQFSELNQLLNDEKKKNLELSQLLSSSTSNGDEVSFNLLQEENDKNSQLCQKISELEAQDTNLQDKLKHREAQLILQHQQSIQIMKQSIQVAVEDNNRLTVQVSDLESQLNDSQTLQTASQDQMDTLQSKLEELSKVNKANHQLGHEKSELEEKCSKLSEQLREAQHNEATQVSRDDNGQNEKLEHWKTLYEDSRNDKVHLENECSELKDKMEVLLQDLAELKQNLVESEQIKESNNILRAQLDHIKTENQTMKAQSVKSEDLRLQVIASRESQQIEGLKQALEEAKNSAKSKCSQLDNQIRELQEILEDSKHSETSQTSENCPKCHFHEEENQAFEKFIQCLKEKNVLLEKHNIESIKEADQFQCQLVHLQANLIELEDSLVSQTEQNAILKSKMEEALHAKASVDDILKKIGGKSLEHESNLESLQDKIKHLCEVDSRAQEYRDIQNNQQAEINELLLKLNAKDDTFEEMKKETDVYRNQYEGLLEEYQQYLQDLESLQSKSETLEKLKKMYEEEISEMQVKSNKKDEELVQANANIHELSIRDQERLEILGRLTELEDCLSKERSVNRELKASLDDKDLMISEFNTVNMKEILDNEEKEQDESENYRNKVDEQQELIHTLQAENKALQLKLEHQELKLEQLEQSHHDEIIQVVCEIPEESEVMEDLQQDNLELREAHMIKEQELKHQSERSDWNSEKQGMLAVLKEKTRDTSHLKAENTQLLQTISDEREHLQTVQDDKESMTKETVYKLSQLIKDKDLEIESLKGRNESLVTLVQNSANLFEKAPVEADQMQSRTFSDKSVIDNSNEIILLKEKIGKLEKKLNLAEVKVDMQDASLTLEKSSKRRLHSESYDQEIIQVNKTKLEEVIREKEEILKQSQDKDEVIAQNHDELRNFKRKAESLELHLSDTEKVVQDLKVELDQCHDQFNTKAIEVSELSTSHGRLKVELDEKVHDLEMAQRNLNNVTQMLEEKSNNSESHQHERLKNIAAIQELQSNIGQLMRERDEANTTTNEKHRQLVELRREVNNVIDKKKRLEQELDRLKHHLVSVEEGYTKEAIEAEERERELRKKLQVTEEALRVASHQQSNTTKVATARLQRLEAQVTDLSCERDQMAEKMGRISHEYTLQSKAMANLNAALEGFQSQNDNDVKWAEKDFNGRLMVEKKKQDELMDKIDALKQQVANANEGLAAANRLSEQLEKKTQAIAMLKHEVKLREDLLKKAQTELKEANSNNTVKVNRYLIKNLVVGYVNADEGKRQEILKIVATVLDFNQEEREKTGLEGQTSSWLGSFFANPAQQQRPHHWKANSTEVHKATGLDLSLAQAFVAFLETESTPKTPVKLPLRGDQQMATPTLTNTSGRSTPTSSMPTLGVVNPHFASNDSDQSASASPLLFGVATPTQPLDLPTFIVGRSSSSILRQVLHEDDGQP